MLLVVNTSLLELRDIGPHEVNQLFFLFAGKHNNNTIVMLPLEEEACTYILVSDIWVASCIQHLFNGPVTLSKLDRRQCRVALYRPTIQKGMNVHRLQLTWSDTVNGLTGSRGAKYKRTVCFVYFFWFLQPIFIPVNSTFFFPPPFPILCI